MSNQALFFSSPTYIIISKSMPQTPGFSTSLELICQEFPKINTDIFHQSLNSRPTGILRSQHQLYIHLPATLPQHPCFLIESFKSAWARPCPGISDKWKTHPQIVLCIPHGAQLSWPPGSFLLCNSKYLDQQPGP